MGLEELRKTLPAAKTADDTFAIFSDYVEADYGDMMKDDFNNILIVRRCLEKHLYQQALTFLESFMPSQYLKSSVLSVRITNPKLLEEGKKKAGKAKKNDGDFCIGTTVVLRKSFENTYYNSRYRCFRNTWEYMKT